VIVIVFGHGDTFGTWVVMDASDDLVSFGRELKSRAGPLRDGGFIGGR
jgi:hypothetical protein